jgi:hypothetical protein
MDSTDMEQAEGMREYTPPKKKKKKKHSQWLNHCRKTQFKDAGTSEVQFSLRSPLTQVLCPHPTTTSMAQVSINYKL